MKVVGMSEVIFMKEILGNDTEVISIPIKSIYYEIY